MKVSVKRGREKPIGLYRLGTMHYLSVTEAERLIKDLQRALRTKTAQKAKEQK